MINVTPSYRDTLIEDERGSLERMLAVLGEKIEIPEEVLMALVNQRRTFQVLSIKDLEDNYGVLSRRLSFPEEYIRWIYLRLGKHVRWLKEDTNPVRVYIDDVELSGFKFNKNEEVCRFDVMDGNGESIDAILSNIETPASRKALSRILSTIGTAKLTLQFWVLPKRFIYKNGIYAPEV